MPPFTRSEKAFGNLYLGKKEVAVHVPFCPTLDGVWVWSGSSTIRKEDTEN